jgi:hypothetical protein
MTIALGMIFGVLLVMALWMAANESPEVVMSPVTQVDPDQTDDSAAWDLMGWHSFG